MKPIVPQGGPVDGQSLVDTYRHLWRHAIRGDNMEKRRQILLGIINEQGELPLPSYGMMLDTSWHCGLQTFERRVTEDKSANELLMQAKETVALELIADEVYKVRLREEGRYPDHEFPPPNLQPDSHEPLLPASLTRAKGVLMDRGIKRTPGEEKLYRELLVLEIFTEEVQPFLLRQGVARTPFQVEKMILPFTSTSPGDEVCGECGRPL
jgi:hypothetical protein